MNTINIDTTVGEIVRRAPARSRVFESLGIDYCCGGKKPLAEACRARGLDPATVANMLTALDDTHKSAAVDADTMSLSELCDHIEKVHHGYLREELPRLDFMTRKVAAVHGEHEPRLLEVRRVFESFLADMTSHTETEEKEAFPAVRALESHAAAHGVNLMNLLLRLEAEHQQAGAALENLRSLTDSYTPPEWACNTFRALYDGLEKLEQQTHLHVHTENNILFPKALAKASQQ